MKQDKNIHANYVPNRMLVKTGFRIIYVQFMAFYLGTMFKFYKLNLNLMLTIKNR